jgi:hypothetical protein
MATVFIKNSLKQNLNLIYQYVHQNVSRDSVNFCNMKQI